MTTLFHRALRLLFPSSEDTLARTPYGEFLLYHQLWCALQYGVPSSSPISRPPLPPELVRIIVQFAGLQVPDRALATVSNEIQVHSHGPRESKVWFWAGPLTDTALTHIAAIQLVTMSCDQGWVSNRNSASYSWFDVGIFPAPPSPSPLVVPTDNAEESDTRGDSKSDSDSDMSIGSCIVSIPDPHSDTRRDSEDWSWLSASEEIQKYFNEQEGARWHRSHANSVANGRVGVRQGHIFSMDLALWNEARAGDVIAVRACAQFQGWTNKGEQAEIRTWKWFEPVIPV